MLPLKNLDMHLVIEKTNVRREVGLYYLNTLTFQDPISEETTSRGEFFPCCDNGDIRYG